MVVGDMEIRLRADIARLQADMDRARQTVGGAMDRISSAVEGARKAFVALSIATGIGAIIAFVGGLKGLISSNIEATGSLYDLSLQTGASVAALTAFRAIGATSDTTVESLAGAMNKLAKGMAVSNEESKGLPQAISAIGLKFADLRKMNPEEQMLAIAKAFDGFGNGAGKSAVAMALYGKEGAKMLPFLADLAADAEKVTATLTDQQKATMLAASAMADNYGDTLTLISKASQETGKAISAGMLPALYETSQAILAVMTQAGGMRDTMKALAADGTIAEWTRAGVTAITYLLDGFDRLVRAVKIVKTIISGALTTMSTFVAGSSSAMKAFIEGDYKKSFAIMKETSTATGDAIGETFSDLSSLLSADLIGEKLRAQLKTAKDAKAEIEAAKPQVDFKPAPEVDAAAQKEINAYAALMTAIRAKTEENRLELLVGEAASDGQKMSIKLDQELATGKLKLSAAHEATARGALAEMAATEKLVKEQTAQRDVTKFIVASTAARDDSAAALNAEYAAYGKSADAREILMVTVKAQADTQKKLSDLEVAHMPISDQMRNQLEAEERARILVGEATLGQGNALKYAAQLADENKKFAAESISEPRARAMALLQIDVDLWQERIKNAGAGTEAQKLLQTEYDTWYANRLRGASVAVDLTQATQMLEVMAALDDAAKSAAQGMANSFGQVGTAIGGLTTALSGYGRTQAAIAAQLAAATKDAGGDTGKIARANATAAQQSAQAQVKSYGDMASAAKGFFKQNSAGYKVMEGAEKAYRAVEMAMAIDTMIVKSGLLTGYTGLFAASKASEVAATVATVPPVVAAEGAKQTALATTAMAGAVAVPFPGNIAAFAIVAAMLAAIGLSSMGGGSAPSVSETRQKANGTGTVLGDSSAKSNSIARAVEVSAKNSNILLDYTAAMVAALNSIQTNIGGFASQLLQTTSVGSALPATQQGTASSIVSSAAFNIAAGGVLGVLAVSIDKLLGGKLGNFVGKIANGIFGGNVTAIDTGVTATKTSLGSAVSGGIKASQYVDTKTDGGWFSSDKYKTQLTSLGASANDQFTLIVKSLATSVTEAGKLLGIGGDAFTTHLNQFVVDIGAISTKDLSGDEIQKAIQAAFSKMGDEMANFAVSGIGAFQKVGEGTLETLVRVATDYANVESVLNSIGKTFGWVGTDSIAARENLIALAGGIDQLASQTSGFASNFLSQAEQLAPVQKYVTDQLAAMGLASIQTRDDFKNVVMSLDLANPAAQQTYASLMALQEAFAKTHTATVDLTKSEQEIADERADLQKQYDQLTMTSTQLRAKERLGISAVNLAVFDTITRLQDAATMSDTLKTSIDSLKAFRDGILSFKDSLTLGSLSTLTPMQKAFEAQRQYQEMLAKAKAGDSTAQAGIQAAATAYLTANQAINASSSAYVAAAAQVQSDLAVLAAVAGTQLSDAQQQLAALDKQTSLLSSLNATTSSIEAALTMPSPTINWSAVGTTNMAPLTEEIKGLRADNEDLRADNAALLAAVNRQTDAVVQATLTAAANNAESVNAGAQQAARSGNWAQNLTAELAKAA